MNSDEVISLINEITEEIMPPARETKLRVLFDIASTLDQGNIVELGTWHGYGTMALCLGLKNNINPGMKNSRVYTIDPYVERKGWSGEGYYPEDEYIFKDNCVKAGVDPILFRKTAREMAKSWMIPIGFWFWDIGADYDATKENWMFLDLVMWKNHILPGGYVYLRDTYDCRFGSDETARLLDSEFFVTRNEPGVMILRKR